MVKVAIVDRNDWFRKIMEEELGYFGVEMAGGSRTPEGVRETVLACSPQVLLWTVGLQDQRGEGVARLLAGLPMELTPALVALGEYQAPCRLDCVGGCIALGKHGGMRAMVRAIVAAAGDRQRLFDVLEGRDTGAPALDVLLELLRFDPERVGTKALRRGVELWLETGEQPEGLYQRIGESFSASASSVERAIRVSVSDAWRKAPICYRMPVFGGDWERTPTNMALMSVLAGILLDAGA